MLGYAPNLDFAQQAVSYVQNKMLVGAANRSEVLYSLGLSYICVAAQKSVDFGIAPDPVLPSWIIKAAAKAEAAGCGNCGEQAAIAMVYLFNNLKVVPLDYVERTNADHAFVVIGRKANSEISDYKTWGDSCVVCDPWDYKAFSAIDIPKQAYKGSTFAVKSRCRVG